VHATEKCIAAGNTLSSETDSFVGAARSYVVGKHAEPNPECFGVAENSLN